MTTGGVNRRSTYTAPVPPGPFLSRRQAAHRRRVMAGEAGRLVLVVEDDPEGAEGLKSLLRSGGREVRVAYTGGAGLILARKYRPATVVCDIGLAELDGFGVAEALRQDPATASAR